MKTWQKIKDNPELLEKYLVREKVIDIIRKFFKDQNFHEVQTPTLVPIPSIEPNLEVFETELRTSKGERRDGFLIMSPEFSIKKLLAAGIGNCFEIAKCFRNDEEVSKLHSPEFTMLEWYRINADYKDIMNDFEQLFLKIVGKDKLIYQGETYDITLPWPRISVAEAFQKFAKKDVLEVGDEDFYKIFFNDIEPELAKSHKPFFIYDYPISQASLSRPKDEDPRFAERFEVFLAGVELGNCFSELTDAKEQKKRFESDLALRQAQGKTDYPIDEDLIKALETGLPPVSGIAVGVDRLIMLVVDVPNISDTMFFPPGEGFNLL
ncbi:MAG TPA: elongation factor P--(R)-beta-lysine ligase [Patescibacteria group bacterium]|nr:elongation factor P--(R)-beta-lysine ligase [Patescibacteria group bacterium]